MIWESDIWKVELARDLQAVRQQIAPANLAAAYDQALVAIEKFAFTSAFIIRKLLEAHKLSDEILSTHLPVRRFPRIDREIVINFLNWHRFEDFYNLDSPEEIVLSPHTLCNLLIHSFVFCPEVDEFTGELGGIFFNSDRTRDKFLYWVSINKLFAFIEDISQDHIDYAVYTHLQKPGETTAIKSRGLPTSSGKTEKE